MDSMFYIKRETPDDKPTTVEKWYENGQDKRVEYRKLGELHRDDDLPAVLEYYPDGIIDIERWYQHGKKHRELGKPAKIEYYQNGKVEKWYCLEGIFL